MISLQDHPEGVIVPVRAQPGARKAGIQGERNGALKIAVTAPADGGRANKALIELLHEALVVKRSQVELVGGGKSRDKRFLILGLSHSELHSRITALVQKNADSQR